MSFNTSKNQQIKKEIQPVIDELKKRGIKHNSTDSEIKGLGDVVEEVLNKFGITEERFKSFFKLRECNCKERKKFLNNLFSWYVKQDKS
jgi:hypothetical protein